MAELRAGLSCTVLLELSEPETSPEHANARTLLLTAALLGGQDRVGSHGVDLGIRTLEEALPEDSAVETNACKTA